MVSQVEANKIDQWLKEFQKEHGDTMVVNDDIIRDLACALCDDIPLGYEASHRLANWLFCHLNVHKICLNEAFDDYKWCTRDLMETLKALREAE